MRTGNPGRLTGLSPYWKDPAGSIGDAISDSLDDVPNGLESAFDMIAKI